MAGDWIKVEKATARKPEVLRLAVLLNVHVDHAFGLCVRFWSWCDDNLSSSNASGVTEALLDALLGQNGFASALIEVGWLQVRQGSLVIPNFDRHLSKSAKSRALSARRTALHRSRSSNDDSVTKTLPEKRIEDKSPYPLGLEADGFRKAWSRFKEYRIESGHGVLQPITEVENLTTLAALGAEKAERLVRMAIRKGWKNIVFDVDDGRYGKPIPPTQELQDGRSIMAKAKADLEELRRKEAEAKNAVA